VPHAFIYDGTSCTTLDVPGGTYTQFVALGESGAVLGIYIVGVGADVTTHGFVYQSGTYTEIFYPDALYT
jgi:hypothetical protein